MKIKSLLFGSTAALVAVSGAKAADAVIVAEPEPVQYVRVCDAYGAGFFYIPGTETCLKVSGYVRADIAGGDNPADGAKFKTWQYNTRGTVRFDARSETELGTLKSFIETRYEFKNGAQAGATLAHAFIELGGFRVGLSDSQFDTWTGSAGNVIRDDVIAYAGGRTNQISYTFASPNGFSALIGLEQGAGKYDTFVNGVFVKDGGSYVIDKYVPHVVGGLKFEQGWGAVSAVGGYDAKEKEWAAKLRADAKLTDALSAFLMGGYQSSEYKPSYYGAWNGKWAVWGGLSAQVSSQAKINGQVAYESAGTIATALNVNYTLVPGFVVTPEINYTHFRHGEKNDAVGGIIRFQRNF